MCVFFTFTDRAPTINPQEAKNAVADPVHGLLDSRGKRIKRLRKSKQPPRDSYSTNLSKTKTERHPIFEQEKTMKAKKKTRKNAQRRKQWTAQRRRKAEQRSVLTRKCDAQRTGTALVLGTKTVLRMNNPPPRLFGGTLTSTAVVVINTSRDHQVADHELEREQLATTRRIAHNYWSSRRRF